MCKSKAKEGLSHETKSASCLESHCGEKEDAAFSATAYV